MNKDYSAIMSVKRKLISILQFLTDDGLNEVVEFGILFLAEFHGARFGFLLIRSFRIGTFELCVETIFEVFQFYSQFKRFLTLF